VSDHTGSRHGLGVHDQHKPFSVFDSPWCSGFEVLAQQADLTGGCSNTRGSQCKHAVAPVACGEMSGLNTFDAHQFLFADIGSLVG
jgi:hypothetical protein